jgi:hypothetical protein
MAARSKHGFDCVKEYRWPTKINQDNHAEPASMNEVDVGAWNANWAWSLPLIVLNVVIHLIGLGLINESVLRVLSGAVQQRRFMPTLVLGMGVAALLATVLHGLEATWAIAYRILGAVPAPNPRCSIRSAQ